MGMRLHMRESVKEYDVHCKSKSYLVSLTVVNQYFSVLGVKIGKVMLWNVSILDTIINYFEDAIYNYLDNVKYDRLKCYMDITNMIDNGWQWPLPPIAWVMIEGCPWLSPVLYRSSQELGYHW